MVQLRQHQSRVLDAMGDMSKGQVIVPTGGGKTLCMIQDVKRVFTESNCNTIVVVAPRILLAQQLSSDFLEHIDNARVMHVHSGDTEHYSSTQPEDVFDWHLLNKLFHKNSLIFTTYHSLHRVKESGIPVNTIYFDEAHNSVQRHFHPATKFYGTGGASRCFFFTATPHHSATRHKAGMNDVEVYGDVIEQVPAPELVDAGYILPPKVVVKELDMIRDRKVTLDDDTENILSTIDSQDVNKILICVRRTSQITGMIAETDLALELRSRGYNWMYITAKTGAVINGKRVSRVQFFETLNQWGEDDTKFVVMHHSILSEGINVNGLEAVLFLRSMNYTGISQTIGRVIRKGNDDKKFGIVCIPVYDRVGISTSRKVQSVVDTVFEKGEPAISLITR
tara:strand:- start:288 stop:1469 length:1182 start_codon:yes stop_codon:yes gene_type:complete